MAMTQAGLTENNADIRDGKPEQRLGMSLRRQLPTIAVTILIVFQVVCNLLWLRQDTRTLYGDPGNHARVSLEILDILRHPGPDLFTRVFDATSFWPPLPYLLSQPLYFLFGIDTDITVLTTTLFFALAIAATYLLGRRLYGTTAGLVAAFLFSFYPLAFMLSRTYYVDVALTAMITVTLFLLVCSETFARRGYALLFGVFLGLSLLTKQAAAIFAIGPVLAAVSIAALANGKAGWRELFAWRPRHPLQPRGLDLAKRLINIFLAGVVAIVVAALWYVPNIRVIQWQTNFFSSMAEGQFTERPYWWYFGKLDDVLLIWPLVLFLVGVVFALRSPRRHWLPLVWFFAGSLILPIITRDLVRYMLPVLPAAALLSAQWMVSVRRVSARRLLLAVTAVFQVSMFFLMSWGAPKSWGQALHVPTQNDFHPYGSVTADRPQIIDPLAFLYYQYAPGPHRWPVNSILTRLYSDIEHDGRSDEFSRLTPMSKILDFEFSTFTYEVELARRLGRPGAQHVLVEDVATHGDFLIDFFDTEFALFKSDNIGGRPTTPIIRDAFKRGDEVLHNRFAAIGRWELQDGTYAELLKRQGPPLAAMSPEELAPVVRYILTLTPQSRKAQRLNALLASDPDSPEHNTLAYELWEEEVRVDPNNRAAWREVTKALLAAGRAETALQIIDDATSKPRLAPATTVELAALRGRSMEALGQLDAAEKAYQSALSLEPQNATANAAMAAFLIRQGRKDQAGPFIETAKRVTSNPMDVLLELAQAYDEAGEADQAITTLQAAMALAPKQSAAYVALASLYEKRDDNAKAVEVLEKAAEAGALTATGYVTLGDIRRATGHSEQARDAYQAAIDRFPGSPAGYLGLSRFLVDTGDFAGSQETLQAGLRAIPGDTSLLNGFAQLSAKYPEAMDALSTVLNQQGLEDVNIYLSLSDSQMKAGDAAGAEAVLRKGIETAGQRAELWLALGKIFAGQDRVQEAEDAFGQAVGLSPDNATTFLEQAIFYETLARNVDASAAEPYWTASRDAYQRANDLSPTMIRPYTGLALYYRVHKDQATAIDYYKAGLKAIPDQPWLTFGLAQTYNEMGDVKAAMPYYRKAVQLEPDNALFHAQLGNVYKQEQQWDQAVGEYREAIRLNLDYVKDINLMTSLGYSELNRGQFEPAVETLRQVTTLDPKNQIAHFYLGQALEGAGDLDGARSAYLAAVELAPTSDIGVKAKDKLQALEN